MIELVSAAARSFKYVAGGRLPLTPAVNRQAMGLSYFLLDTALPFG